MEIFPKRHTAAAASIVGHHQGHDHNKSSFGANKEYLGHADTLLSVTLVLDIKLTLGDPEHCVIWMSERVLAYMKFQGGGLGGQSDMDLDAGIRPGSGSEGYGLGHLAWQDHFLHQHCPCMEFRVQILGLLSVR